MECNKCHKLIPENATICPHCKKVFALKCPNCHTIQQNAVCDNCGYIILEKCSKCGKLVPTDNDVCKCGYPVKSSISFNECENDEFAAAIIQFGALKNIRNILASNDLYKKFYVRLQNLLLAQLKNIEGTIIKYGDRYIVNFNRELSLASSSNKAIRLAIKIINAFSLLNLKVTQELGTNLKLTITIIRKQAEDLLQDNTIENNVKLLTIKKQDKKYLHGMQIVTDQFVHDTIAKEYKSDSLYTLEQNGFTIKYYEIILDNYVLPPNQELDNNAPNSISKSSNKIIRKDANNENDLYAFNVFDINANCKFEKYNQTEIKNFLGSKRIISIKSNPESCVKTSDIMSFYDKQGIPILHAVCSEEKKFKPWGILEQLFRDYYHISEDKSLIPPEFDVKIFTNIKNLLIEKPIKSSSSEDARFAYMEDFENFLASLKDCAVLIENFENIDDTTIQTLDLFFSKYKHLKSDFIFTTNTSLPVHSKIKGLLRNEDYLEVTLQDTEINAFIAEIKQDATDFISSFYYEKINDNFNGSKLYYENAIQYLLDKEVLINFEDRLLIKNNTSVLLPVSLNDLIKARLKHFAKNMDLSMTLAYSNYLGPRMDFGLLQKLGINNVEQMAETLQNEGFGYVHDNVVYINNYSIFKKVLESSIKPQVEDMLLKNIFAKIGNGLDTATTLLSMGKISMFKEEYLMLWKNSQYAMKVGDFDAYLQNCLAFLSLTELVNDSISEEEIHQSKLEVFQNILMSLYTYSPTKIYSIENVLLMDAMNNNDDDKIIKLSNLMLQGALISSNYTDALSLLHNILTRMQNPNLIADNEINPKFVLLSLVNIEILFNIGEYSQCIQTANDLLEILNPEIIEKIKPSNFSIGLFIEHILETFRLVCFAKLIRGDNNLEQYFTNIQTKIGNNLKEEDCILTIQQFLSGKDYVPSKIETENAFSKVIYLILQELSQHADDYKKFAQNIYQAKLLANDLHQKQIEYICELLIAHSYAQIGLTKKAEHIYNDILNQAQESGIFNIIVLTKYFMAKLKLLNNNIEDSLYLINDALALIQNKNNESKLLYVLLEKLFIEVSSKCDTISIDIESETKKLCSVSQNNEFARITGYINQPAEQFDE